MAKLAPSDYDGIDVGVGIGIDNFLDDSVDLMTFYSCFILFVCICLVCLCLYL